MKKISDDRKKPALLWIIKEYRYSFVIFFLFVLTAVNLSWSIMTSDWGLKGDFYLGENFDRYLCTGYKKTIDFYYPEEMDARLPNEYFSTKWTGTLLAPHDGVYTFYVSSDDGSRFYLDKKILIDKWFPHYEMEFSNKIFLTKGPHLIDLDYFQLDKFAVLRLSWALNGGKKEIIPSKYLRH